MENQSRQFSNQLLVSILSTVDTDTSNRITRQIEPVNKLAETDPEFIQSIWKAKVADDFDIRMFPEESVDWRLVYLVLDKEGIENCLKVIYDMQVPEVLNIVLANEHLPVLFLPTIDEAIAENSPEILVKLVKDPRAVDEMEEAKKLPGENTWRPASMAVVYNEDVSMLDYLIENNIAYPEDLTNAADLAAQLNKLEMFKRLTAYGKVPDRTNSDFLVQAAVHVCWDILNHLQKFSRQLPSEGVSEASRNATDPEVQSFLRQNF